MIEKSEYQQSLIDAFDSMKNPLEQDRWVTVEMTESDRREWEKLHAYILSGDLTSVEEFVREFYQLKEENGLLYSRLNNAANLADRLVEEKEYICGDLYDLACENSRQPSLQEEPPTNSCTLTPDQRESLTDLELFLKSKDLLYRIQGYAGTGKSFLVCEFIKSLKPGAKGKNKWRGYWIHVLFH